MLFSTHPLVCSFSQHSLCTHREACSRLLYAFSLSLAGLPVSVYNSCGAAKSQHSTKPQTLPVDMVHSHEYIFQAPSRFFATCKQKLGVETGNEASPRPMCLIASAEESLSPSPESRRYRPRCSHFVQLNRHGSSATRPGLVQGRNTIYT